MTEDSPATGAAPWQSPTLSLDGRVAIVAGAGQTPGPVIGNGRATCVLFARAGAHVVALDRDRASAEETAAIIEAEGAAAEALAADVTDEQALIEAVRSVVARHGRIDVLQNNVGVAYTGGDSPLADLDEASFDRVMAINLRGTVMACKHVVPVMRSQGSGVITNISSIAAVSAAEGSPQGRGSHAPLAKPGGCPAPQRMRAFAAPAPPPSNTAPGASSHEDRRRYLRHRLL
ncbi:MAG: SDR family NAD(P)-dependent oxidoreductase, partial [Rhodospirillaceae bacterium]|nr:SDR family NAD(P)-dependent oxidoreductase [Rhodospirillaceae bacterium]